MLFVVKLRKGKRKKKLVIEGSKTGPQKPDDHHLKTVKFLSDIKKLTCLSITELKNHRPTKNVTIHVTYSCDICKTLTIIKSQKYLKTNSIIWNDFKEQITTPL